MDHDDVCDLMAYWRAKGRAARGDSPDTPPDAPPSPEDLMRTLDAFNARFAGKIARV